MNNRQQSDSPSASDWMTLIAFLGSVLFGSALPFFMGIVAVHRLLPFGNLQPWMHGWQAVLGVLGIFLCWFFVTFITDRLANLMASKHRHPLLNELAGDTLSTLVLFALMSSVFTDWRASFICALIASALTVLLGFVINAIMDRNTGHGQPYGAPEPTANE